MNSINEFIFDFCFCSIQIAGCTTRGTLLLPIRLVLQCQVQNVRHHDRRAHLQVTLINDRRHSTCRSSPGARTFLITSKQQIVTTIIIII